jgi:hypothetical protein
LTSFLEKQFIKFRLLNWNQIKHYPIYFINASQFGCKPNGITILPKFWKGNGYDPNNILLPKFWSRPWFGHAKILVGHVWVQTKHAHIANT